MEHLDSQYKTGQRLWTKDVEEEDYLHPNSFDRNSGTWKKILDLEDLTSAAIEDLGSGHPQEQWTISQFTGI